MDPTQLLMGIALIAAVAATPITVLILLRLSAVGGTTRDLAVAQQQLSATTSAANIDLANRKLKMEEDKHALELELHQLRKQHQSLRGAPSLRNPERA